MMLSQFSQNFLNENKSKIIDLFYGVNHSLTKCCSCQKFKHKFYEFPLLIFPLEKVGEFIFQNKNNIGSKINMNCNKIEEDFKNQSLNMNIVSITDCFEYNQRIINYSGNDAAYCQICNTKTDYLLKINIYSPPEIFILILERNSDISYLNPPPWNSAL